MSSLTDLGKFLALILRHKPEAIGITLDEHGWANVEELIEGINKTDHIDMDILEEIVRTDNKEDIHSMKIRLSLEPTKGTPFLWMLNYQSKSHQNTYGMELVKST